MEKAHAQQTTCGCSTSSFSIHRLIIDDFGKNQTGHTIYSKQFITVIDEV